jgi:hypothetical protein
LFFFFFFHFHFTQTKHENTITNDELTRLTHIDRGGGGNPCGGGAVAAIALANPSPPSTMSYGRVTGISP